LAKIGFSAPALEDFERVVDVYTKDDPHLAAQQVAAIRSGVEILAHHPFVGRVVRHGLRELVISRGKTGFLVLYRFLPRQDTVRILRIRHQRELRYP
jgi:plasmid stabilization system protein ParE